MSDQPINSTEPTPDTVADADTGPAGVRLLGLQLSYRNYALMLLTLVYIFNNIDRQILSILLQSIKVEFGASDTQLGFLYGLAFAVFYSIMGIPFAMLADRYNRKKIITISLTAFSALTATCGLVAQFWQLVVARFFIGIGEAGTNAPSHSMIADLFPPKERGTAMGIFALGVNISLVIGFFGGGWINQIYGWRPAFLLAGIPGIALALLLAWTLKEPARTQLPTKSGKPSVPPIRETIAFIWARRSLRHIGMGAALQAFMGLGTVIWLPAFLVRSHGMNYGEIGTYLALVAGVVGAVGTFLGGYLADRLSRRDMRWYLWLPGIAMMIVMPVAITFFLTENKTLAMWLWLIPAFLGGTNLGPVFATTQSLVPANMRAVTAAMLLLMINLVGAGLGPQIVGIASDALEPTRGAESLRYALLGVTCVAVWIAFHYWRASVFLREDLASLPASLIPSDQSRSEG